MSTTAKWKHFTDEDGWHRWESKAGEIMRYPQSLRFDKEYKALPRQGRGPAWARLYDTLREAKQYCEEECDQ